MFSAILISKTDAGQQVELTKLDEALLPEGDVTVDIEYSTLNYKDGLAITGKAPVVRQFPMVPGVDFAGTVRDSSHADWKRGDKVVLNCWGVGESHWGGFAQTARLKGDWLIPLPKPLTNRQAMVIGTAGYTAALCVEALLKQNVDAQGEILVTGATGGVGSITVALLAKAGFRVVAVTGKAAEADYLKQLGAATVIDRNELSQPGGKPLQKQRWAAAVDSVGSHTLANVCAQTRYGGAVIACGNTQGMDFPATVAPFILRAVSLIGVECVVTPKPLRLAAWARLARDLDPAALELIATEIGLTQTIAAAADIVQGKVRGRIVIDVNK